MKASNYVIKAILHAGGSISCWDGEEYQYKRTTKFTEVRSCVDSVDLSNLELYLANGEYVGTLAIIEGWDMADEETICDYSYPADSTHIDDLCSEYSAKYDK